MGPITLTPGEYELVAALRGMPESALRDRVQRLVKELAAFARNPHCPEFQADGVPCPEPSGDCDQCQVVTGMLEALERNLRP